MSNSRKGILRMPFKDLKPMYFYHMHNYVPRSFFVVGHFWDTLCATCVRTIQLFKSRYKHEQFRVGRLDLEMTSIATRFRHEFEWLLRGLDSALQIRVDPQYGYLPSEKIIPIEGMVVQRKQCLPSYWLALRPHGVIAPIHGLDHLLQLFISYTKDRLYRYTRYKCLVDYMLAIIGGT